MVKYFRLCDQSKFYANKLFSGPFQGFENFLALAIRIFFNAGILNSRLRRKVNLVRESTEAVL